MLADMMIYYNTKKIILFICHADHASVLNWAGTYAINSSLCSSEQIKSNSVAVSYYYEICTFGFEPVIKNVLGGGVKDLTIEEVIHTHPAREIWAMFGTLA